MNHLASQFGEELFLIPAIKASNDQHKEWAIQKLREELGSLTGKNVAILGLTYKANTDTLRRSLAIELCRDLIAEGVAVTAFDPVVAAMPADLTEIQIMRQVPEAVKGRRCHRCRDRMAATVGGRLARICKANEATDCRGWKWISPIETSRFYRTGIPVGRHRKDAMKLKNKISLITGASQGLGKAIAELFVKEGAQVAICARDSQLIESVAQEFRNQALDDQKIFAARPAMFLLRTR